MTEQEKRSIEQQEADLIAAANAKGIPILLLDKSALDDLYSRIATLERILQEIIRRQNLDETDRKEIYKLLEKIAYRVLKTEGF